MPAAVHSQQSWPHTAAPGSLAENHARHVPGAVVQHLCCLAISDDCIGATCHLGDLQPAAGQALLAAAACGAPNALRSSPRAPQHYACPLPTLSTAIDLDLADVLPCSATRATRTQDASVGVPLRVATISYEPQVTAIRVHEYCNEMHPMEIYPSDAPSSTCLRTSQPAASRTAVRPSVPTLLDVSAPTATTVLRLSVSPAIGCSSFPDTCNFGFQLLGAAAAVDANSAETVSCVPAPHVHRSLGAERQYRWADPLQICSRWRPCHPDCMMVARAPCRSPPHSYFRRLRTSTRMCSLSSSVLLPTGASAARHRRYLRRETRRRLSHRRIMSRARRDQRQQASRAHHD